MQKSSHDHLQSSGLKKKHKLTEVTLQILKAVARQLQSSGMQCCIDCRRIFVSHLSWLKTVALNNLQVDTTCPESSICACFGWLYMILSYQMLIKKKIQTPPPNIHTTVFYEIIKLNIYHKYYTWYFYLQCTHKYFRARSGFLTVVLVRIQVCMVVTLCYQARSS
jgi:hypothetical protein